MKLKYLLTPQKKAGEEGTDFATVEKGLGLGGKRKEEVKACLTHCIVYFFLLKGLPVPL